MRLFKRCTALALALSLGQLVLVGGSYGCEARTQGTTSHSTAGAVSVRAAPDAHADCGEAPASMPCALSGIMCTAMGACGVAAMTIGAPAAAATVSLTSKLAVLASGRVPTRSIPPELPPPRA